MLLSNTTKQTALSNTISHPKLVVDDVVFFSFSLEEMQVKMPLLSFATFPQDYPDLQLPYSLQSLYLLIL